MQLVDRIEKRRFVGREFLTWLWFESELFDATLSTKEHGSFGMWVERLMVLDAGKAEVTRIKGATPAATREAKEGLLRGKLPQSAGLHVSQGDRESSFTLKAESLSLAGLKLPAVLGADGEEDGGNAVQALAPRPPPRRKGKRESAAAQQDRESDQDREAFYERMHLTRDVEALVEALYRDFLALRLSEAWDGVCVPMMRAWAAGQADLDAEDYREARARVVSARKR
jgi:hypothetical protein